ncbi:hypothetical protein [Acuticoccus kandeliae]|nr:hypothetical protein [Acuticoccus kandeliae]
MTDPFEKQHKNAARAKNAAFFTLILVGAIIIGVLIIYGALF